MAAAVPVFNFHHDEKNHINEAFLKKKKKIKNRKLHKFKQENEKEKEY